MAGRGTISVNQSPQYGDTRALNKLKTGMTTTPMTGVPTPAPTAGRPPTRGGGEAPASAGGGAPQQEAVDPEHQKLFTQLAQATRAAQMLAQAAQQPGAGPWTQFYSQVAQKQLQGLAAKVRDETPFVG